LNHFYKTSLQIRLQLANNQLYNPEAFVEDIKLFDLKIIIEAEAR